MFRYKKVNDIVSEERKKRLKVQQAVSKCAADIDFLAMMTEVELDAEEEENE